MSLFGTSPEEDTARVKGSGLFGDEPNPAARTSAGLFDGEDDQTADSPWAIPTPRKGGRNNVVKNLLPASDVPDTYVDAFDALLESGEQVNGGLSLATVKAFLARCGISTDDQSRVLGTIASGGHDTGLGLGRNEFNVLLALVGLAQEGEDISLDGVDERRKGE